MSLKELAKDLPDGWLKESLKEVYSMIIHTRNDLKTLSEISDARCQLGYSIKNGFILKFRKGNLTGLNISFPGINIDELAVIPNEIPGYFKYGVEEIYVAGGACPGDTVVAAAFLGAEHIIAIEPHPSRREILSGVIKANNAAEKVTVLPYRISNFTGSTYFVHAGASSKICKPQNGNVVDKVFPIYTTTLDSILEERQVFESGKTLSIQWDIEGGELNAFNGAMRTWQYILEVGGTIAIAGYHKENGIPTWIPLKKRFEDLGFGVDIVNPKAHITLVARPK